MRIYIYLHHIWGTVLYVWEQEGLRSHVRVRVPSCARTARQELLKSRVVQASPPLSFFQKNSQMSICKTRLSLVQWFSLVQGFSLVQWFSLIFDLVSGTNASLLEAARSGRAVPFGGLNPAQVWLLLYMMYIIIYIFYSTIRI